jgi:radical SAM superfamily enzyme YgiQ (UPF0313 family)
MAASRARERGAREIIEAHLADERGLSAVGSDASVCLTYPSPYAVGMSSLGFQTLYRQLNEDGPGAHRAFLPEAWSPAALPWPARHEPVLAYESMRPLSDYRVIALSVAYELEVTGVIRLLEGTGIPVLAADRGPKDPIVIAGGPLTTTNPSALLPFVDLLICGDGEVELPLALERIAGAATREASIAAAASSPHAVVGELERDLFSPLPPSARAPIERLPAYSAITTPNTELSDMFLVEPERGCSRRCTFCVMRGATTGGMRLLDIETPLSLVPAHARRVGLVGAAVTDHPQLEELVASIVASGRGVGVSSLRADRLNPGLLRNLAAGGYRQITVASDGISERLRKLLHRKITADDLRRAARLVADDGAFTGLKVYQMIGAPTETDDDVDELVEMCEELRRTIRLTLTISTFVAKRNTPLDGMPFLGVKPAEARLRKIRQALGGRVEIRPQSPRWAHVEYLLAQAGPEGGHAALDAVRAGGRYADWTRAFAEHPASPRELVFGDEAARARRKGRAAEIDDRPHLPVIDPRPGSSA